MSIRSELSFRLPNTPGALARACQLLADERVNIIALGLEAGGTVRMVVDNHVHALGVLRDQHYQVEERDVIYTLLPNDPGSLARLTRLIADTGFNLDYVYATSPDDQPMAAVVLGVADAQRVSAAAGL